VLYRPVEDRSARLATRILARPDRHEGTEMVPRAALCGPGEGHGARLRRSVEFEFARQEEPMNWDLLLPLLVTTTLAIGGWIAAHWFSAARDQRNKRREVRLGFLLKAYRRLEAGASRGPIHDSAHGAGFESAIADIQLLGTTDQSRMAKDLAHAVASQSPDASAGPLLLSLRDELRRELNLETLGEAPVHFRLRDAGEQGDADGPPLRGGR